MRYTLNGLKIFFLFHDSWLIRLSGKPEMTASGGRVFDPAGQFVVVNALKQGIFALDETKSAAELRTLLNAQMKPLRTPLRSVNRKDRTIDVDDGSITIAEFSPKTIQPGCPAIVYFHGGGYSSMSIESCRSLMRILSSKELGAIVYAVDYRLAPNTHIIWHNSMMEMRLSIGYLPTH